MFLLADDLTCVIFMVLNYILNHKLVETLQEEKDKQNRKKSGIF